MKPWFWIAIITVIGIGLFARTNQLPLPVSITLWGLWLAAIVLAIRYAWKKRA